MKRASAVYNIGCNKGADVTTEVTTWQSPSHNLTIGPGELHLWRFKLYCPSEKKQNQQTILSADELARAERLLDPQKKYHFILVRNQLRRLMGKYLDLSPSLIRFRYNETGKPFLATQHDSTLSFNLSHSGSWAVIAVSADSDVGIDVEKIDSSLDFQQLATRYFDQTERTQLTNFSPIRQRRGFYRLWTRKESVLKKVGSGFSALNSEEQILTTSNSCCLKSLFLASDYVATVTTNSELISIIKFDLPA